jgi:hypothetical protein
MLTVLRNGQICISCRAENHSTQSNKLTIPLPADHGLRDDALSRVLAHFSTPAEADDAQSLDAMDELQYAYYLTQNRNVGAFCCGLLGAEPAFVTERVYSEFVSAVQSEEEHR